MKYKIKEMGDGSFDVWKKKNWYSLWSYQFTYHSEQSAKDGIKRSIINDKKLKEGNELKNKVIKETRYP